MKKNLKITTELYMLLIGIAVALIFVVFFTKTMTSGVYNSYEAVINRYDVVNVTTSNICTYYAKMTLAVDELFSNENVDNNTYESAVASIDEQRQLVADGLNTLNSTIQREDLMAMVSEFADLASKEDGVIDEVLNMIKIGELEGAYNVYVNELKGINEENDAMVSELNAKCQELANTSAAEAHSSRTRSEIIVIIIAIVVLIIAFIFEIYVVRDIRIPLEDTVAVLQKISKGDINVEVKKHKNNEFGVLADYMQELLEREHRVTKIANSISNGDLTVEINPKIPEDVLSHSLKSLIDNNNYSVSNIRDAAVQVGIGSSQVANASQALAQGSTEQASALQQVTASITDITGKTRANADDAAKANNLILSTKENAERGNSEMANMLGAMNDINEASENISRIIKTIDDIAFQTNILALNAAVEAARAGEHGKGFAVVAEEVRSLAAKSAEAASETEQMIEDSIQKVHHGSQLAQNTANMLSEIVTSVEDIVVLMSEIATASNDQATALTQIDQAIMQVSQVVQTNSATSEQCAAASDELSNQAKNLEENVNKYKLKSKPMTGGGYAASPASSASSFIETSSSDSFGGGDFGMPHSGYSIPDASDFSGSADTSQNEQIISLDDKSYSKY